MRPRVLVVEHDAERAGTMIGAFSRCFDCRHVGAIEEVMAILREGHWAAAVVNYNLDGSGNGIEVLQMVRETLPRTFRLVYTEVRSPSSQGNVWRMVYPHFMADVTGPAFITALECAIQELLEPPSLDLPADLTSILADAWTARAPMTRWFLSNLRTAAEQETPVYIYGEPGTGVTRAGSTLREWRREWRARGSPGATAQVLPVQILRVPTLRERLQDLPLLAARCLLEHARQADEPVRRLSRHALEDLVARAWYGNVIELSAVLAHAVQRAGSRLVIEAEDLPRDMQPAWRPSQYAKDWGQRDCIHRQLRTARNVSAASRLEGCSRANYIRLMRRLGIIRADIVTEAVAEGAEESSTVS